MIVTMITDGKVVKAKLKLKGCKLDPKKALAMKQIREAIERTNERMYAF